MFQSSAIAILVSTFVVLVVSVVAQDDFQAPGVFNISDPLVGATLEHYVVSGDPTAITKFACANVGSRCAFNRDNYESVDHGTGQETENTEGPVWAAVTEGAVLTLGPCNPGDNTATSRYSSTDDIHSNSCVVTCNANCTCAYISDETDNEPQLCRELASRAPTPSPKTAAPVAKVCPQQQFATEFCPTLMNANTIPDGTIQNYDCFNFCGGVWIDTCDIATGTCGATQCENATATGSLNGIVKGCTIEHYNSKPPSESSDNQNSNGTSSTGRTQQSFGATLMMATIIVAVFSILNL